jgi:rhodanese-related sulfurtransferase
VLWGVCGSALGMSPERLLARLADRDADRVVVIDIRNRAHFNSEHVPGSLHIPLLGIEGRTLPGFGQVVVIWDGIDRAEAVQAVGALNAKPGIDAELLEGGYPAWSASGGHPGGAPGLGIATTPTLSYDQLLKVANDPDLVVVDLRESDAQDLTDLNALLPNTRIVAPLAYERHEMKQSLHTAEGLDHQGVRKRDTPHWLRGQSFNAAGFYVLIDAGDGRMSERVARRLSARGVKRVFVLLGGERVLQTAGEPGVITRTRSGGASP